MSYTIADMLDSRLRRQWNELSVEVQQGILSAGMNSKFLIDADVVPRDPETTMPDPKYFVGSHITDHNQMYYTLTSLGYTLFVWTAAYAKRSTGT